jgi:malonyl-CoA/methylmalonyl-CoA synthetase
MPQGDAVFAMAADGLPLRSHAAFWRGALQFAAALVAAGLKPGDRVAVQAPKSLEMLELYLGTVLAGGVYLPLNTAYTVAEVSYFLADADPAVVVGEPGGAILAAANHQGVRWTLDAAGRGSAADAAAASAPLKKAVARGAEDLAAILYTSGTTGRSKGAMLSHRALAENARVLVQHWGFTRADVLVHALPIFHTHGLFVASHVALMAGAKLVFLPKFEPAAIVQAMPHATALMGVPTFYTRLLEQPGLAAAAGSMRLFISGSAPLLADTHEAWQKATGHAILERYGMTETNMNTSNPLNGLRKAGTVGMALPGVAVVVTDPETGRALPVGEVGMIEIKGPNLFSGYWNMPEKTREDVRDTGFFISGDLGRYDEQGYLHIVGRSKDLIISGGFNIYPKEIELLIDALPGVAESAVVGVPHPDFGEAVVAVVVPAAGHALSETMVMQALALNLARFKQPKAVHVVADLPRNAMGKVQKAVLRKQFGALFTA